MRVLRHHAERRLEVVVHLVDVFVDALVVQRSVQEVVPRVLNHETNDAPRQRVVPAQHRNKNTYWC